MLNEFPQKITKNSYNPCMNVCPCFRGHPVVICTLNTSYFKVTKTTGQTFPHGLHTYYKDVYSYEAQIGLLYLYLIFIKLLNYYHWKTIISCDGFHLHLHLHWTIHAPDTNDIQGAMIGHTTIKQLSIDGKWPITGPEDVSAPVNSQWQGSALCQSNNDGHYMSCRIIGNIEETYQQENRFPNTVSFIFLRRNFIFCNCFVFSWLAMYCSIILYHVVNSSSSILK